MRTGEEYLGSLDDGRVVFADGERIAEVASHPGFEGITRTVAGLYDAAAADADMHYVAPETGRPANRVFMIPRSVDDLGLRRRAITSWASRTGGFVGRSPDHVGGFFAGFASAPDVFALPGRPFGENVSAFYRRILDESLYVSYVIIPPQGAISVSEASPQVAVVDERDDGMVVRGAQILGTSCAVSDFIFVSCIRPLRPEEEAQGISFVVPAAAPGVKILCRRLYAAGQPSVFDYPLSTRFDETDAVVVLDDVMVPWEHVFVYRDVERTRSQFFATPAHILGNTQAQIRFIAKMKFVAGIARKIAEANDVTRLPPVQELLGELAALAALVEGMVVAAEATATLDGRGVAVPNPRFVYSPMALQGELYPRMLHGIRELSGAGMLQVPASVADLLSDETRDDVVAFANATALDQDGTARVKLFKLAWDLVGSEFGGRHHQYEMFYAGAPFVTKTYALRNYGYDEAVGLVDEFLASYGIEERSVT